ncbi:MAG: pentapeptide repeat-containing protein [candidate division Zixibacteria bacterium]|nr:pentapeptide repeat-containing protein [candidate division Zixibacteria bacterium]
MELKQLPWIRREWRTIPKQRLIVKIPVWPIVCAVALTILFIYSISKSWWPQSSGFYEKTLWDWVDLLIIPAGLALGGVLFALLERRTEYAISEDRELQRNLETYLDRMAELLLNKDMRASRSDAEVLCVARARTHIALEELDGRRKSEVVRFLIEMNLLGLPMANEHISSEHYVSLTNTDLSETQLVLFSLDRVDLKRVSFWKANLKGTFFRGADLQEADFAGAIMTEACFEGAALLSTFFEKTYLFGASFENANCFAAQFEGAYLGHSSFRGANLFGTSFKGANLEKADFTGAKDLTWKQVRKAKNWKKAILPDHLNNG